MTGFHPLTVTEVRPTIRDAVVVTLKPEASGDFSFIPGQYLTLRTTIDGVELRRSYSICAGLDDGVLQVGIKRVAGGAFSNWANDNLKPGLTIDAMEPAGRFHTPLDPSAHRHYLAFAGGSGITPVLSLIKSTLAREPASRFTLVYANRAVNTIMFRDELEDLKNRYMDRLSVLHILETDTQEIDLFTGRIDAEKCAALFRHWIDIDAIDTAFICGPEPMMLAIAEALRAHGLSDDRIKYELFKSAQPGRLPQKTLSAAEEQAETRARVILDGTARSFAMRRDQTVLEAALAQDIDVPHSCRAGVCSTCRCKVIEGRVEMAANHALEDDEVASGYALSCQSFPLTDRIVVDYDQ
ncbi:1,2-phenylacetyl-CoA epoxidase subunit PaaE [Aestuariicoccus sp. MJ-SS9]|uniref:1,2-phenylacetyl-CoA epoxidase subunit PaaE n=1 Tax=Aestuariicoccus sp. MJ-SS9 TaxID=3079855 RepID=UPI00290A680C|nr:1,2-phenylacetyl-CoA epoxidase subunit PaaE [Aestuariicoccus sp. MJ-SS9]MDU8910620.1 1,2-phenylacetyl-CoA epoxidase subunit PaaE [Aestuariicoccus sp. MJ-SS9]